MIVTTLGAPADYQHADVPALTIAIEYLSMIEGELWKIRAAGLAYGAGIREKIEAGTLFLYLLSAVDAIKAWHLARQIVQNVVDELVSFSPDPTHSESDDPIRQPCR